MISDIIDAGSDLTKLLIGFVIGGIAFGALFIITDQIVQNSGYAPLQTIYQMTKPVVTTASDVQDGWNFVESVGKLVALFGGGGLLIWLVTKIDFSDFMS